MMFNSFNVSLMSIFVVLCSLTFGPLSYRPRFTYIDKVNQHVAAVLAASLLRDKTPTFECPSYDTKPSDDKAPLLENWRM